MMKRIVQKITETIDMARIYKGKGVRVIICILNIKW